MREKPINLRMPEAVRNRWKTLTEQVGKREHWLVACAGVVLLMQLPHEERLRLLDQINSARFRKRLDEFMAQFDHSPTGGGPQIGHVNTPIVKGGSENTERTGSLDVPRLPPEKKGPQSPRKRFPAS